MNSQCSDEWRTHLIENIKAQHKRIEQERKRKKQRIKHDLRKQPHIKKIYDNITQGEIYRAQMKKNVIDLCYVIHENDLNETNLCNYDISQYISRKKRRNILIAFRSIMNIEYNKNWKTKHQNTLE